MGNRCLFAFWSIPTDNHAHNTSNKYNFDMISSDVCYYFFWTTRHICLLPAYYKMKHLLVNITDPAAADPSDYVPDCVRYPKIVSLNKGNVQSIFLISDNLLTWKLDDDDPSIRKRKFQNKRVQVDTSKFTSDIHPVAPAREIHPVLADEDFDIPDHVMPTAVNHSNSDILHGYWS